MTARTALVVSYSQTGHTRGYARVVGAELREAGLTVHIVDYRDLDALPAVDLLVVGTPVFYADVPSNLVAWVRSLPDLHGTSAAAFSCFGGHGDGQEHTAHALLRLLVQRGGRPVGAAWFGAMSTFAPTWSKWATRRAPCATDTCPTPPPASGPGPLPARCWMGEPVSP